jgi:hypothetical protein
MWRQPAGWYGGDYVVEACVGRRCRFAGAAPKIVDGIGWNVQGDAGVAPAVPAAAVQSDDSGEAAAGDAVTRAIRMLVSPDLSELT